MKKGIVLLVVMMMAMFLVICQILMLAKQVEVTNIAYLLQGSILTLSLSTVAVNEVTSTMF